MSAPVAELVEPTPTSWAERLTAWRARRAAARRERVGQVVAGIAQTAATAVAASPAVQTTRRAGAAVLVALGAALGALACLVVVGVSLAVQGR